MSRLGCAAGCEHWFVCYTRERPSAPLLQPMLSDVVLSSVSLRQAAAALSCRQLRCQLESGFGVREMGG